MKGHSRAIHFVFTFTSVAFLAACGAQKSSQQNVISDSPYSGSEGNGNTSSGNNTSGGSTTNGGNTTGGPTTGETTGGTVGGGTSGGGGGTTSVQPLAITGSWMSPCAQDEINGEIFNSTYTITFSGTTRTVVRNVYNPDGGCNTLKEVDTFSGTFSVKATTQTYTLAGLTSPVGAWDLDYTTQWKSIRLMDPNDVQYWNSFGSSGACGSKAWEVNKDVSIVGSGCSAAPVSIFTTAVPTAANLHLAIRTQEKPGDTAANRPVGPNFAIYAKK